MKNCKQLSKDLLASYSERVKGARIPEVTSACAEHGTGEGFELSYAGGILHVKAQSPLAEVYALSLLNTIVPSGHWQERIGLSYPRFPLRPLWLQVSPENEQSAHWICKRAAELGYNALAWSGGEYFHVLREYGLKSIALNSAAASTDYILHEGQVLSGGADRTLAEMTLQDLQEKESSLPKESRLIYFVPYQDSLSTQQIAQLILTLYRECRPSTCLAFSAVAGLPTHDHLPPHPFWEVLRSTPQLQGGGFLPIFNVGALEQGEGFWPSVCVEQMELLLSGCRRHAFAGAMGMVRSLPGAAGFLEANMWIMSQLMWRECLPVPLLDTWLRSHKKEAVDADMARLLKGVREVVLGLSRMRWNTKSCLSQDEFRHLGELLVLLIRGIEAKAVAMEKSRLSKLLRASLSDYLVVFLRDVKRLLKQFVPSLNIEDDGQDSIWTKGGMDGASGRKATILEQPYSGLPNSKLAMVYAENVRN